MSTPNTGSSRIAVVTDIHGNLGALHVALADLKAQRCDRIVCLGDMVDGGDENDEAVRTLIVEQATTVLGNHDEFNRLDLAPDVQAYIRALPKRIVEHDVVYTHISPREFATKVLTSHDAWGIFREVAFRLTFVGHSHLSYVYGEKSAAYGTTTRHALEFNTPFALDPHDRYVISVGAIGYPRDGIQKVRYGIYDQHAQTLEIRALDGPLL